MDALVAVSYALNQTKFMNEITMLGMITMPISVIQGKVFAEKSFNDHYNELSSKKKVLQLSRSRNVAIHKH